MAKDPAFLFYPDHFTSGTQFLNDEQVGKYIRLLCAQHQHGHLTEKQMMHICKSYDEDIFLKFSKDEVGLYFNKRLELEITRRKKYSESRSDNRSNKNQSVTKKEPIKDMKNISESYDEDMVNVNVNVNSTVDSTKKGAKKNFQKPTEGEVVQYFLENGYTRALGVHVFKYYNDADWLDSKGEAVKNWKQKSRGVWFHASNKTKYPDTVEKDWEVIHDRFREPGASGKFAP